jgi:hypothetical protein
MNKLRAKFTLLANRERMPLPAPTSITTLPPKSVGLLQMASWYVPVRTASYAGARRAYGARICGLVWPWLRREASSLACRLGAIAGMGGVGV